MYCIFLRTGTLGNLVENFLNPHVCFCWTFIILGLNWFSISIVLIFIIFNTNILFHHLLASSFEMFRVDSRSILFPTIKSTTEWPNICLNSVTQPFTLSKDFLSVIS
jgi:hypothetical protein